MSSSTPSSCPEVTDRQATEPASQASIPYLAVKMFNGRVPAIRPPLSFRPPSHVMKRPRS